MSLLVRGHQQWGSGGHPPTDVAVLLALQCLWKSRAQRRDQLPRCLFWYIVLYLIPTGIFTAALANVSYSVCNSPTVSGNMSWFCKSRFLQFLFTVVVPFVLLMVWQNAVIPANLYK